MAIPGQGGPPAGMDPGQMVAANNLGGQAMQQQTGPQGWAAQSVNMGAQQLNASNVVPAVLKNPSPVVAGGPRGGLLSRIIAEVVNWQNVLTDMGKANNENLMQLSQGVSSANVQLSQGAASASMGVQSIPMLANVIGGGVNVSPATNFSPSVGGSANGFTAMVNGQNNGNVGIV